MNVVALMDIEINIGMTLGQLSRFSEAHFFITAYSSFLLPGASQHFLIIGPV